MPTLHLEFKTTTSDKGGLGKDDRRMIAKAICGLANAEGGTLVLGILTRREDNVDVAVEKRPIRNVESICNRIKAAVPEVLSPQLTGISVHAIFADAKDEGYIVIDVPASDDRPHFSNSHHQYFRRGADGTRPMEHGEIRDVMLAMRTGRLELFFFTRQGGNMGGTKYYVDFVVGLRNVGRVPIRAPYLRMLAGDYLDLAYSRFDQRRGTGSSFGFYTGRDSLIHVGDYIEVAGRQLGIEFDKAPERDIRTFVESIRSLSRFDAFDVRPSRSALQDPRTGISSLTFSGAFGAENVPAVDFERVLTRNDILQLFEDSLP